MTRTISAPARRVFAVVILMTAAAVSSWQPPPNDDDQVSRVFTTFAKIPFVPPLFTVAFAQTPVKVCTKKPVAGETMSYALNSSSAIHSNGGVHIITSSPTTLNFAGLTGPAGLFASAVSLPAGNYTALSLVMDNVMIVRGVVTCDADGAGPIPTRTYYTGGNPVITVPDPFVLTPSDAAPVATTITSFGGDVSFTAPVPFTVSSGGNTTLNITYDTNEGFSLWDISVITGVPNSYKIVPNDIRIMAAMPTP